MSSASSPTYGEQSEAERKRKASELTPDRNSEGLHKRKESAVARGLIDTVEAIKKHVRRLTYIVNASQNTKREIKDVSLDLQRVTGQLNKQDVADLLQSMRWEKTEPLKQSTGCQTVKSGATREFAIQTNSEDIESSLRAEDVSAELMKPDKTFDHFSKIDKEPEWLEQSFQSTAVTYGSLEEITRDASTITLVVDTEESLGSASMHARRQAELEELLREKGGTGQLRYLIKTDSGVMSDEHGEAPSGGQKRVAIAAKVSAKERTEELYEVVQRTWGVLRKHGSCRVVVNAIGLRDQKTLRRILEYTTGGTNIQVDLYRDRRGVDGYETELWEKQRGKKSKDTILLKVSSGQEGKKSYAETMKKLRKQIDIGQVGISTLRTKITKEGVAFEVTERKRGAADRLIKEMGKIVGEDSVTRGKGKMVTLIVRDLEDTVEADEIRDGIEKALGQKNLRDLKITEPRTPKNGKGSKYAQATIPINLGQALVRQRRIVIGWSMCRIEEMITPPRCYRCQNFGHASHQCQTDEPGKRRCLKCGGEDHLARDCKNDRKCYVCGTEGHRADSMACVQYREAVKRERARRSQREKKD